MIYPKPLMPTRWKPNVTVAAVIERDGRFLKSGEKRAGSGEASAGDADALPGASEE